MAFKLADRIRETSTTSGTTDLSLAGAVAGYKAFSALLSNGDTCWYTIVNGPQWETGVGTYATSGNVLQRTTIIESSNSNAKVNFSAGTKDVFVSLPGSKAIGLNGASETLAGVVEMATTPETAAGLDTQRATTPAGVAAAIIALSPSSTVVLQTFTTSGAFTKEVGDIAYFVEAIGGGGSGANQTATNSAGGGCGGMYTSAFLDADLVSSPVTVTIGAGGAGAATGSVGSGIPGGNTSFGTLLTAPGGAGGSTNSNSRSFPAGSTGTTDTAIFDEAYGYGGLGSVSPGGSTIHGGGGGGGAAGGGGGSGGSSVRSGNGSAGNGTVNTTSLAGTAPGGGSGGSTQNGGSGAGARGEVRVYRIKG